MRTRILPVLILILLGAAAIFAQDTSADKGVQILNKPRPVYTEEARKQGIEGVVRLRVEFLSTGEIGDVQYAGEKSKKKKLTKYGLVDAAAQAARQIKFIPAFINGKNVTQTKTLEFRFDLY